MVPKRPDTMADMVIAKCVRNRWLNAFFPILVLFGAHILSFYEWKIVQQLLGDNSNVTCLSIGKSIRNIYMKRYNFRVFSFTR